MRHEGLNRGSVEKTKGPRKRSSVDKHQEPQNKFSHPPEDARDFSVKDMFDPCWSWKFMRSCGT